MRTPARRLVAAIAVLLAVLVAAPAAGASPAAPRRRADTQLLPRGVPTRSGGGDGRAAAAGPTRSSTLGGGRASWAAYAPASSLHFDAIPRIGGNWPGDPTGAVGNSFFLTAANSSYALYDLSGAVVIGPQSLGSFFGYPAGTVLFDPKVVYDQYDQTFVMTFLAVDGGGQRSWITAVTIPDATAADPGTWCATRITADRVRGDGRQWPDYPGLGYDADRVAITTNQFSWSTGLLDYAQIVSWPKMNLYTCSAELRFQTFAGADTTNPDGTTAATIQPAQSVGGSPTKQFFLSFYRTERDSFVVVWRLSEVSGRRKLSRAAVRVPDASVAPYGTQGGGKIEGPGSYTTWWDPGDLRLVNAWYDADLGMLYAAHAVEKDLGPDPTTGGYVESVVRWYEIGPASKLGSSTLERRGTVGSPETDAGWPVVGTDESGNLFVTYNRASAPVGEYLSAWVAEILPGKRKASVVLLAAGQARVEVRKGPERWGDYNGISRDPVTGSMALINQYALFDGSGTTRDWQQTVDVVGHA